MLTNFVDKLKKGLIKKKKSHIIRRQLQEIKQNTEKTIYCRENEDLATEGYEGIPEYFKNTVTIDEECRY